MPFSWPLAVALYFTIWWVVLLAVLPLGVRNLDEAGEERLEVADPGAPVAPQLWKKAGLTTIIAAVVFGLVTLYAKYAA
jgi:predicted secreted protein